MARKTKELKTKKPRAKRKTTKKVEKPVIQVNVQDNEQIPYLLMDAADDQQILKEINGQISDISDALVYCFTGRDGKQVTGLSWVGTKTASFYFRRKKLVNLSVEEITYRQDPQDNNYYIFEARIKDLISGATSIGIKRQCTKLRLRNGKVVDNEFWVEQGRTKAIRNAMQDLMPTDWIARQVKEWVKKGNFRVLNSSPVPALEDQSLNKIKPFVDKLSLAKTKEELAKLEGEVIADKNLTGKEKFTVRQMIAGRIRQL